MTDIGASLREARMRAKLDITEVEADTKIRGKYLRALENEEWSLLPGATFVRSFLRTYGDYLGIDGRMLVEEFKLRHGGYDDRDLPPLGAPRHAARDRSRRATGGPTRSGAAVRPRKPPGEGPGRGLLVAGLVGLLVLSLVLLGTCSKPKHVGDAVAPTTTQAQPQGSNAVTLRIRPKVPVYACLRAADGRRLIDGTVLTTTTAVKTYSSASLRLALGTGAATLIVNGKPFVLQASSKPRGYDVSKTGPKRVADAARVACR